MSQHVEWMNAASPVSIAAPGEFEDGNGTLNDETAIVLGFDDVIVIEGTKESLLSLSNRVRGLVLNDSTSIPRPGHVFDGRIVVASCYMDDDTWLMILLNPEPSYFSVVTVEDGQTTLNPRRDDKWDNIVHATRHYIESGGDA